VQGDWNDQVGAKGVLLQNLRQKSRQGSIENNRPFVLEPLHSRAQGLLIDSEGNYPAEGWDIAEAGFAEVIAPILGRVGKGAAWTAGGAERVNAGEALRAEKKR
jgi:hypothetical protein